MNDFLAELNRLANGGVTYRQPQDIVDENLAANQWAGTADMSMVGALNIKAGNAAGNYRALLGVLNQLAGTSNLDRLAAIRAIPV